MKCICLFSNCHNGDVMLSKSFIKDIAEQLDIPVLYQHNNSHKTSIDIPVIPTQIHPNALYEKFVQTKNILFVNVWLYPYLIDDNDPITDITIESHYYVYYKICEKLNEILGTKLELKSVEYYLPYVDPNFIDTKNIDEYVSKNENKKILISNGPCLSGQAYYNGDMSSIIGELSLKYNDIIFIPTHKFETKNSNIHFTDDIIRANECDLNEIGYLSKFCDIIIGRNSGPYVFCWTKENLNNPNKIFYSFGCPGTNITDCFYRNIDVKCKSIFEALHTEEEIFNSIDKLINENIK